MASKVMGLHSYRTAAMV